MIVLVVLPERSFMRVAVMLIAQLFLEHIKADKVVRIVLVIAQAVLPQVGVLNVQAP